MKTKRLIKVLSLAVAALFLLSNGEETKKTSTIGTFDILRPISMDELVEHFGKTYRNYGRINENIHGEDSQVQGYYFEKDKFKPDGSLGHSTYLALMDGHFMKSFISNRDKKYAINGKIMVGDHKSKIKELNLPNYFDYGELERRKLNYITASFGYFEMKSDREDFMVGYVIRFNYNDDGIITSILISGDPYRKNNR